MKKFFCNKVFKSLLATGTVTVVIQYLMLLSDTLIIGNVLGEQYLSAVNIVKPIYSFAIFIGSLVSIGTSVYYSYQVGVFNGKKANQVFSQGVIIAIFFGVLLLVTGLLGKNAYFNILKVSEETAQLAKNYYFYYQFVILIGPVYTVLLEIIYADGDEMICNIACIAQFTTNIVLSLVLCKTLGINGVGLGSLVGMIVSIIILMIHFVLKKNTLKFSFYFNIKDTLKVFKSGMTDGSAYLFIGLTSFVASKFVISKFGEYYLPILLCVFDVIEFTLVFDGIGQAITPIVNVYRGEGNQTGIRRVMKSALIVAIVEGVLTTTLLCIFGKYVSYLFGLRDETLIKISTLAIRLVSPFFFCTGILFLQTTYYMIIGKEILATGITGFKDAVVPIIMMCSLGYLFGLNAVWVGLGLSPFVSLVLVSVFLIIKYGRAKFPLLFDKVVKKSYIFDAILEPNTILDVCDKLELELRINNFSEEDTKEMLDTVNYSCMKIYNHNPSEKVLVECSLLISNKVEIIIRDNGKLFDLTKSEEGENLPKIDDSTNLVSRIYMITIGYNRNMLCFERKNETIN